LRLFINKSFTIKKLNRTICDLPLQSKIGQLKLQTNAKTAQLLAYRQAHAQHQQQASQLTRKVNKELLALFRKKSLSLVKHILPHL
jgi:hypothetical protein